MVLSPFAGQAGLELVEAQRAGGSPGEIARVCVGAPAPAELASARASGMRVLWLASGAELADPAVLAAWLAAGLDGLHLWVHAASAAAHEFHAGAPGGFAAAVAAIRQARAAGIAVAVSSLLTRSSAPLLGEMPRWLRAQGVAGWRIAAIALQAAPRRGPVAPLDGLIPQLSVALPHALQALSRAAGLGLPAFIAGAPRCLLGPFAGACLPEPGREFAPGCAACPGRTDCGGLDRAYLERFGAEELDATRLRAAGPVAGPRWMFVGTGLLRHVEADSLSGAPRRRHLPVLGGPGDGG